MSANIPFYTMLSTPQLKKIDCTDEVCKIYGMTLNKDGSQSVKVIQKYNQREYIQSFRKECDIYEKLKKFQNGDITALSSNPGFYGDVRNVPTDLLEVNSLFDKMSGVYNSLDKEVLKKQYDVHNLKDFINACMQGKFVKEVTDVSQSKDVSKKDNSLDIKNPTPSQEGQGGKGETGE